MVLRKGNRLFVSDGTVAGSAGLFAADIQAKGVTTGEDALAAAQELSVHLRNRSVADAVARARQQVARRRSGRVDPARDGACEREADPRLPARAGGVESREAVEDAHPILRRDAGAVVVDEDVADVREVLVGDQLLEEAGCEHLLVEQPPVGRLETHLLPLGLGHGALDPQTQGALSIKQLPLDARRNHVEAEHARELEGRDLVDLDLAVGGVAHDVLVRGGGLCVGRLGGAVRWLLRPAGTLSARSMGGAAAANPLGHVCSSSSWWKRRRG